MEISASEIQFSAQHHAVQKHIRKETLVEGISTPGAWDPETLDAATSSSREQIQSEPFSRSTLLQDRFDRTDLPVIDSEQVEISRRSLNDLANLVQDHQLRIAEPKTEEINPEEFEASPEDRAKIQMIVAAIEGITGKKIKLADPADLRPEQPSDPTQLQVQPQANPSDPPPQTQDQEPVWGLQYSYHEQVQESESSSFSARGVVSTSDGEEIEISLDLTMSRKFLQERSVEVRMGAALKDPLVINFDGTAAELTQRRYQFDIDSDGTEDQIHFVNPNSGFLALDRNQDGAVTNGTELFGTVTGNGFEELAEFDEDGNGWIDKGDAIYNSLRVWSKDQQGNDQLVALGQKDVGAIYLGHITTPFELKDQENQLQGVVRSSGIYLNENGTPGTIQQVDLVV
jgi:hypothetical protein